VARAIDGFVLGLVTMAIGFSLVQDLLTAMITYLDKVEQAAAHGLQASPSDLYSDPRYASALSGLAMIQLSLSAIYHTSLIALRGATLGKIVAGVRVRPWAADRRPSWGQAAVRWLTTDPVSIIPVIGLVYPPLDSLWLLWDERRQCLHDKVPATCVVRSR
jgi:uncharacterized RDD family membrane protein YckC